KFLLQQADAALPGAQDMSALATGLVKNTTGTGVQSIATASDLPAAGAGAGVKGAALLKTITLDAQGRVTATSDGAAGTDYVAPNGAGSGDVGPKFVSRERAITLLGVNRNDDTLFQFFDDFPLAPRTVALAAANAVLGGWDISSRAGSGSIVGNDDGAGGGFLDVKTGATGSSKQDMLGRTSIVSNVATKKWYMRMRFALGTTPDAQAILFFGW